MTPLRKGYEWVGTGSPNGTLLRGGKYLTIGMTFTEIGDYYDTYPGVKRREDLDEQTPTAKAPKPKKKKGGMR